MTQRRAVALLFVDGMVEYVESLLHEELQELY